MNPKTFPHAPAQAREGTAKRRNGCRREAASVPRNAGQFYSRSSLALAGGWVSPAKAALVRLVFEL